MALNLHSTCFSFSMTNPTCLRRTSSSLQFSNQLVGLPFSSSMPPSKLPLNLVSRNSNYRPIHCSVSEATESKTGYSLSFALSFLALIIVILVSGYIDEN